MSNYTIKPSRDDNTGGGARFPSRLKQHDQWLVTNDTPWNDERHKSSKYPARWKHADLLSFEEAYNHTKQVGNTALAFCFTDEGPFVGFDLDKVMADNKFTDEALEIVRRLDSYTEVSSSGTGLHVIVKGEHIDDRKNRGDLSELGEIEVYDQSRYFVLTGDVYNGYTSVENQSTAVREIQIEYLPKKSTFSFTNQQPSGRGRELDGGDIDATPDQVRRTIREYVKGSNVDEETLRLWTGSNEGRTSKSEADMALVKQLYYWCKGDQQLIDACFRSSGRMRSKWDEQRGDQTYGEMTIRKVSHTNDDTFGGRYVS